MPRGRMSRREGACGGVGYSDFVEIATLLDVVVRGGGGVEAAGREAATAALFGDDVGEFVGRFVVRGLIHGELVGIIEAIIVGAGDVVVAPATIVVSLDNEVPSALCSP